MKALLNFILIPLFVFSYGNLLGNSNSMIYRIDVGGDNVLKYKAQAARSVINAIEQDKLDLIISLVDEKAHKHLHQAHKALKRFYGLSPSSRGFPQFVRDTAKLVDQSFIRVYSKSRAFSNENAETISIEIIFNESQYNYRIQDIIIHKGIHKDATEDSDLYKIQCGVRPRGGPSVGMLVDFESGKITIPHFDIFLTENIDRKFKELKGVGDAYGVEINLVIHEGIIDMNEIDEVWLSKCIKSLTIMYFRYEQYPQDFLEKICHLTGLEHLDLSVSNSRNPKYRIGDTDNIIPRCIFENNQLKTLKISGLREVPPTIKHLSSLTDLTLIGKFNGIPIEISQLTKLKKLRIINSSLREIPSSIFNISSVEELHISFPLVKEVPSSISNLENLESLKIHSMDSLFYFPSTLNELEKLSLIQVVAMDALPSIDGGLIFLDSLRLQDIKSCDRLNDYTGISYLKMYKGMDSLLTINLLELSKLKEINITKFNNLTTIKGFSGENSNLENVTINALWLDTIPIFLQELKSLKRLSINRSGIRVIPENLANWKELEYLDLSGNLIELIPSSILELEKCQLIRLTSNKLNNIADEVLNFEGQNVMKIQINFNPLKAEEIINNSSISIVKY